MSSWHSAYLINGRDNFTRRKRSWLNRGIISEYAWGRRGWGKQRKTCFRTGGAPAEIRTQHLPNTSLMREPARLCGLHWKVSGFRPVVGCCERGNETWDSKGFFFLWLYSPCGPWPLFQFRNPHTQSVGLFGRGISPSQGRYLPTEQHKSRINVHRHPCLEWDSNSRSQRQSERRQFMP
jgi:hypothetical protein